MSAKFDKEIHNSVDYIVFTSLFLYMSIVTLIFDLCDPQNQYGLSSQSSTFDKETSNGVVSIVFTRSMIWMDGHTEARTEPQQRFYIPTATRCARIMN